MTSTGAGVHESPGEPFIADIRDQPDALSRSANGLSSQVEVLEQLKLATRQTNRFIFTGMGGSHSVCYPAVAALRQRLGDVSIVESSELLYFGEASLQPDAALVVVSQSGRSAEAVKLAHAARGANRGTLIVSVTNGLDNPLATLADIRLDTLAGPERAGPATVTFGGSLVMLAAIANVWGATESTDTRAAVRITKEAADRASVCLRRLLEDADGLAYRLRSWLGDRSNLVLIGRGPARAVAAMGALTLKEAARFPAEGIESAQFRHGPLEMAGPEFAAITVLTDGRLHDLELNLGREVLAAGGKLLVLGTGVEAPAGSEFIELGQVGDPSMACAVALAPVQLLAWRLAVDQGHTPGKFNWVSKVTVTG